MNKGESKNSVEIKKVSDYLANYNYPEWYKNKFGQGLKLESQNHTLDINLKCIGDGELNISLKGLDIRDSHNKRIPIYLNYTKFLVNNSLIFDDTKTVCHDKSFNHKLEVKDKDIIKVHVEWELF